MATHQSYVGLVQDIHRSAQHLVEVIFHHGFGHQRHRRQSQRAHPFATHRENVVERMMCRDSAKQIGIAEQTAKTVHR